MDDFDPVEVIDGKIVMTFDGERGPVANHHAWWVWINNKDSHSPQSRQYAADIRAALDEIGYLS